MAQHIVTVNSKGSLTTKTLMDALNNRAGFARLDVLFRDIYGRDPVYSVINKVSELHAFQDELEEKCTTTKTLALEGMLDRAAVLVSWRNKSRVFGDSDSADGIFPKSQMPADVRPKKRARKVDPNKAPAEPTVDWIPGVALVEPEWFSRDATAELMLQEYQAALIMAGGTADEEHDTEHFYNIGLGRAQVKYCKPATGGGFLVTLEIPAPRNAGDDSQSE
jgi:hypothetical protein